MSSNGQPSLKEIKGHIMTRIIMSSMTSGDTELMIKDGEDEFEGLPFAYKVLSKKLTAFKVKTEFTHLAVMLLALYSEENPGMVQVLAAQCIESNQTKVDVNLVVDKWAEEMPSPSDKSFAKLWDSQKIEVPVTDTQTKVINAVDAPAFWIYLTEGQSITESIQTIKSNLEQELRNTK